VTALDFPPAYKFKAEYYTMRYDIYLLQLGFHPVAVCLTLSTEGKNSNIDMDKEYRSQNTQNRKQNVQINK